MVAVDHSAIVVPAIQPRCISSYPVFLILLQFIAPFLFFCLATRIFFNLWFFQSQYFT